MSTAGPPQGARPLQGGAEAHAVGKAGGDHSGTAGPPPEFLSDDEVESLLQGVAVEDEAPPEPGVRAFDLATAQRIVRPRMPALDGIGERFARLLRLALFTFLRRSPEITVGPTRFVKHGDFLRELVSPANLNVVKLSPLPGQGLVVLEPTLVFLIVDTLFGGDGRFRARVEAREFTATELRIVQRFLQIVLEEYRKAWQPVHALKLEYVRSEMHAPFAHVAAANDVMAVASFSIEFGAGGGALHLVLPCAALDLVRDVLAHPDPAEATAPDQRWTHRLSQQVQSAEVTLIATLATATVKVRDLLALNVGDVLAVEIPGTIEAAVDGVPILDCTYGVRNGQYALRIERVRAPAHANLSGESHG